MKSKRGRPAVTLLLAAAIAAMGLMALGCGSDGGDDASASALTRAEFIRQGDDICRHANREQAKGFKIYAAAHRDAATTDQAKLVMTAALPPLRAEIEELSDLPAPKGDQEAAQNVIVEIEAATQRIEEDPVASITDPGVTAAAEKAARSFGFKVCGEL